MAQSYVVPQNKEALVRGGLTPGQASVYEALVQHGQLNARRASFMGGVSRTLGYKILGELEALGLVIKMEAPKSVAVFSAVHPLKLKELAERRLNEAKDAKAALDSTLSKLVSDYNRVSGQPGITIFGGIEGYANLLEDQLNENQPMYVIRSPKHRTHTEVSTLFSNHLVKCSKQGLMVKSVESFDIPADVVIYANKVAIQAYDSILMTTIIENMAINMTFLTLFEFLYRYK